MSHFKLKTNTNIKVTAGTFLISEPLLQDCHFQRSVIYVCSHVAKEGTVGFVLNKMANLKLSDIVPELYEADFPIYIGGPVEKNSLFMIHRIPELIGGIQVSKDVYWGGDFEKLIELIEKKQISYFDIRFFMGYSGWSQGQLKEEINENTWMVTKANEEIIFETPITNIWKASVQNLGESFKPMLHMPINPSYN
jgi:putative transcriptional regulator